MNLTLIVKFGDQIPLIASIANCSGIRKIKKIYRFRYIDIIGSTEINFSSTVRNLGFIMSDTMTVDSHIINVCRS